VQSPGKFLSGRADRDFHYLAGKPDSGVYKETGGDKEIREQRNRRKVP